MKKLILIGAVLFASVSQAEQPVWKTKLENYKTYLETVTDNGLWALKAGNIGWAFGTCGLSVVATGAAFITDTIPLGAGLGAEIIANTTDPNYQTYERLMSWETLGSTGKSLLGGGVVGVAESLEYVMLYLGGNEDQAWEKLKGSYASSMATMNKLFAEQGQCMMSISKIGLITVEMRKRGIQVPPMNLPPVAAPALP